MAEHSSVSDEPPSDSALWQEQADLRFMAQASARLARCTDVEETLRQVAALSVPHFADWCTIDMLSPEGELERLVVAHADPQKVELAERLHRRYESDRDAAVGPWHVVRTRMPELLGHIPESMLEAGAQDAEHLQILRSLGLRSYMCVPMIGVDRLLGVITFVSSHSGRVYGAGDLDLACDLVARAAVAVQNAELLRSLRDSQVRHGFLLALTDVLRRPGTTARTLTAVCEMLGGHFHVNRVGYGQVDELRNIIDWDACWTDGTAAPLLGLYPASAFGPQVIARLQSGQTVAIANVREHPLTSETQTIATSHEVDTRAILVVPLFKEGRLRTVVYLNQRLERAWTADEIGLMEEVAERSRELIERGRAEDAVRESEARWRGLFERMAEGFFTGEGVRDESGRVVDFRFLEVNPAFEALTGIAPAAVIGRLVTQAIPGFQPAIIQTYGRVIDSGQPEEFEVQVPALDDRWYEARARAIGPNQFAVLFLEITERKQVQFELARSADRYRTLFESIDEGFCILEVDVDDAGTPVDYRFLEVNPAFERQSGLSGAVGRSIRELVPDIEAGYIETYGRVALTGQSMRFESHAEALHRWFDAFAFRVGPPALRRVALLFTDITDRKLAQTALAEREYELRESQRLARIGSWHWDLVTGHMESSPELLRIFGLPDGEPLPSFEAQRGRLYPEDDWRRLQAAVEAASTHGQPYAIDLRALRMGQPIWVTAQGVPLMQDGRVVRLRGTVQEVTERKQIEEALREADVRKDEFLATLAHELRNPLAPLRNGLEILRRDDIGGDAAVRARQLMERQLVHLVRLVDDLLDVSRVSQGKIVMKKSPTTLEAVVEQALETARPLIDAAGHAFSVELPPTPIRLDVDATRLSQVLGNLLNNAAKYTPAGGRIALRASTPAPAKVRVEVQDSGIGIPAHMLEDVFGLFTQVGSALDRAQGGLGIGLSLARRLVELHGGTLHAESAGEHRGSTFVFELSTHEGADPAPTLAVPPPSPTSPTGRRVLLVDDNVDAAETLGLLLGIEGHQVQVVHTGRQAIEAAAATVPDVVLLDIGLPDMTGYEVAGALRRMDSLRGTLLVAVTGWGAERDRERSRLAGIDLHLTKPIHPDELTRALSRAGA